jgi:hypothetical protein
VDPLHFHCFQHCHPASDPTKFSLVDNVHETVARTTRPNQKHLVLPVHATAISQFFRYEFQKTEKFRVDSPKGKLAPNEEIFVTCWYTSDLDEVGEHSMNVICEVQYLFSEEGVKGETVDIVVIVLRYTIYSELCLTPTPKECQIVTHQNLFRPFRKFTNMGR